MKSTPTRAVEVLDKSPSAHILVSLDGNISFSNAAFWALSGRSNQQLYPLRFQDLLAKGGAIFFETQFLPALLLRGSMSEISFDLIQPGGDIKPVFASAVLNRDSEGQLAGILIVLSVAVERRLYEKELLRSRKHFEQVAEMVRRSSDAILSVEPDGTIASWNNGAEQIFGLPAAQAVGRQLVVLFEEESRSVITDAFVLLRNGQQVKNELIGLHSNGHRIDVAVSLTPHMEAPGRLVAFSAIIRDVTTRKLGEKALLQNEKLASVGRLASSIAHEINNPLASVTNLLYILQSKVNDSESQKLVTLAQEELARVTEMVTHTLRFHKQSSSRSSLDVRKLANSVLSLYRARFADSQIEAINDSEGVSPLICFESELRQILVNLVSNAFDALRRGGKLTIRNRDVTIWRTGVKGVRISVADTGIGMDPATVEHAFEPFFSTKGIGGTGLGLWITQELVEKNGGTIRIRSSAVKGHSGTVVTLLFPHNRPSVAVSDPT